MSAYTEFYCDPVNGSNLNAGSTTAASASVTETNGGWNSGTGVFTAASGTPFSGVSVGEWASIYNDGASTGVFVGRITAIGGGGASITVSLTASGGSAPTTSGTGRSCKVGGAWKGPNGSDVMPFSIMTTTMRDASNNPTRFNFKNNADYNVSAACSMVGSNGVIIVEGYTSTPGDGGFATFQGAVTGSSYIALTINATNQVVKNLNLKNNGATGVQPGISFSGNSTLFAVSVSGMKGPGVTINSARARLVEVESYSNGGVGFSLQSSITSVLIRCNAHDNTGAGFDQTVTANCCAVLIHCIADSNGGAGFVSSSQYGLDCISCDAYNNTGDGFNCSSAVGNSLPIGYIENSNFVKNGGYGINAATGVASAGVPMRSGILANCAFGAGTQANGSGAVLSSLDGYLRDVGRVTYASNVTPWSNPGSGNFTVTLAAAIGTARSGYTEKQSGYGTTLASNAIGAGNAPQPDVAVSVSIG